MVRVVLDTNVLVSAALNPAGNERLAVEAIQASASVLIVSTALLAEYQRVAMRPKFRGVRAELVELVAAVRMVAHHVSPRTVPLVSRDAADDMVLACAQAGAADYLVTGNLRDFPATWYDTRVLNARAFLADLAKRSG